MNYRKHGLRLSGLLLIVALGVMAFAASAQAVTPGFLIAKKPALAGATVTGAFEKETVGTMLVPALNFQLSCTTFTTDEGVINTTTDAKAVLLFSGCTTLDLKTLAEIPCHVIEPIKAEALILPAELTDGTTFAVLGEKIKALIRLIKSAEELGKEVLKPCTLPEDNVVTGDVCFKITAATNDTVEPLVESPATCKNREVLEGKEVTTGGVPDLLKYGANPVTLDGKGLLSLTGVHKGLTLGVSLF